MQIIAMGGGGFSGKRDDPLARYVLAQSGKRRARVCFIPTASGDAIANVRRFERAIRRLGATSTIVSVFNLPTENLATHLCRHDVIFVGGGNTRNMLALWKLWGLDAALRTAYRRGVILSGSSAGAICWFRAGLTDSFPGRYAPLKALGWLAGSFTPHFDSETERPAIFRRLIRRGELPGGFAVDDGVGLHFVSGELHRAVSSRKSAGATFIKRRGTALSERSLWIDRLR